MKFAFWIVTFINDIFVHVCVAVVASSKHAVSNNSDW